MIDDNVGHHAWGVPSNQIEDFPSLQASSSSSSTPATAERIKQRESATLAFQMRKKAMADQEQSRPKVTSSSKISGTNERSRNFAHALGLSSVIEARVGG